MKQEAIIFDKKARQFIKIKKESVESGELLLSEKMVFKKINTKKKHRRERCENRIIALSQE